MNQRWWGGILVSVVLLAAIVVPNLGTHRVAGEPVARKVTGPPSSGDCVIHLTDPWRLFDQPGTGNMLAGSDVDVIDFPSADYGPCDGSIVGEVVSVSASARPPATIGAADYQSETSPCAIDAIGYTGSIPPVVERSEGQPGIVWSPAQTFEYTTVGPDRAQRAVGQEWSACIIGPIDGRAYVGRLQNVLTDGWLPPAFGACFTPVGPGGSIDLANAEQVPCNQPHPVELLGSTTLGPQPVNAADLQAACTVFAARTLRTADPTRQGAIHVGIVDFIPGLPIASTAGALRDTMVACLATGQHGLNFNGSLVGIVDRPLPVA